MKPWFVDTSELQMLNQKLLNSKRGLSKLGRNVSYSTAQNIIRYMKPNTPYWRGLLRKSIGIKGMGGTDVGIKMRGYGALINEGQPHKIPPSELRLLGKWAKERTPPIPGPYGVKKKSPQFKALVKKIETVGPNKKEFIHNAAVIGASKSEIQRIGKVEVERWLLEAGFAK